MKHTILDEFESEKTLSEGNWSMLSAYQFPFDTELVMLQEALNEATIPNVVIDKSNGAINPFLGGENGAVRLFVRTEQLQNARKILDNQQVVTKQVYDETPKTGNWITTAIIVVFIIYSLFRYLKNIN